ncbi:hypothetical protein IWW36_001862 [Coemansia brasiliensis]|uniref:Uncharacterized protein n=1 Tax=Coemansia brasiliensis TaxID=2650707 RepID=A0A9W8IEL5_9FUNG|nr:hypothetical protein IWW36_001862 [Coemansia brasiliensis]
MTEADGDGARRQTLQDAEDDVLQHMGLLEGSRTAGVSGQYRALLRPRRWRRSRAIALTQKLFWLAEYPIHTRTTLMHLTQQTPPMGACLLRGFPLGMLFQRIRLWPQGIASMTTLAVRGRIRTFIRSTGGLLLHYCVYAMTYGLVRQALVAQVVGGSVLGGQLLRPSLAWVCDLLLLRAPRGAVFSMYVCDTVQRFLLAFVKQGVSFALLSLCVVPRFTVAFAETRSSSGSRSVSLLQEMAMPLSAQSTETDANQLQLAQSIHEASDSEIPSKDSYDWRVIRRVEFLSFTEAVSSALSRVVTRALMYPIDTVLVRLMADEAGLTAYGFSGFFACLRHIYRSGGVSSLFYGFTTALTWDLALAWSSIEVMHFLCRSAWVAFK